MFGYTFEIIKQARKLARESVKAHREEKEKSEIARLFNDRYTYRIKYGKVDQSSTLGSLGNYAWMCPSCNKIHNPLSCSGFSGLQYPACCKHFEGHRLDDKIKKDND